MWLVDSSVFIDWMRRGTSPTAILKPYILGGQAVTCGIVRVEVLRGLVKPAVKAELEELFDVMSEVPVTAQVWRSVADLAWELDRKGHVLPVSDLIIAASARKATATVVTLDRHFERVPGLQTRRTLPPLHGAASART